MTAQMQATFKAMSESRGLWHGATVATHQDLSALFLARTAQLYLREDGRFAFVVPNAALDRGQYAGFRDGAYPDPGEPTALAFDQPWDLRRLRPHFFPRAAAVVRGHRTDPRHPQPMPVNTDRWTGRIPATNQTRDDVDGCSARETGPLAVSSGDDTAGSPYGPRFARGATVLPRKLFVVDEQPAGPLGLPSGSRAVRSASSAYEKQPWKDLAPLEGVVEDEFVRRLYLGETVLPFRTPTPKLAVVPLEGSRLLDSADERLDLYPGLAAWWRQAEETWRKHRSSDRLELIDQLDYRRKLTHQFPAPTLRVAYTASGMHVSAATVTDPRGVIEHALYWAAVETVDEARYLCAILNSPKTTELVRP